MGFRSLALFIGVVYAALFLHFKRWEVNIIYGGDSWGYYGYLPAAFIYGDLHNIDTSYLARFRYIGGTPEFPTPGGELPVAENGHRVIKYTSGVALLQFPFFVVGHTLAALWPGVPADGYSWPYLMTINLANLVYLFIGFWLLYLVLWRELPDRRAAAGAILLMALATNLLNFAVYRGPMAHSYLFALYAALLYATQLFYDRPAWRWALLIGVSAGFITLIRPVEIICLAIPLGYGLSSRMQWRQRLGIWGQHWRWLVGAAVVFVCCGLPQLFYWRYATGHWHFDSYPGEAFDFAHARIHAGLFSYQNGWLVYSPIVALALLGIGWLFRHRNWLWPTLVILPLHVWIAYSWWCWYYINGFGSRPMVELYPLLAIPLAYVLHAADKRRFTRIAVLVVGLAAVALNIFQNWQHSKGILWTEAANRAYYWAVFGKTSMSYDALVAFDSNETQPDSTRLSLQRTLLALNFETPDSTLELVDEPVAQGKAAARLTPQRKYLEAFNQSVGDLQVIPGQYLRASAWCYKTAKEFPWYTAPALVVAVEREGKNVKYTQVRIDSKLANPSFSLWGGEPGHWGWVRLFFRLPDNMQDTDRIKVFFIAEQHPVLIDDLKVELWSEAN